MKLQNDDSPPSDTPKSNETENVISSVETKKSWWHGFKEKWRPIEQILNWVKKLLSWTIARLHGSCTPPPWRDSPPGCEVAEKEFKNSWLFPLDWFIRIPNQIRSYELWKEHLKGKHLLLKSSSPDDENSQDGHGINVGLLREHYKMQIGLYEKYLNLLIRFNLLDFAITGAILSFSLQNIEQDLIRWSFAIPCAMNFFFAVILLLAFRSLRVINREIIYMARFLGFQPPGVRTLRHALLTSFVVLTLITLVLLPTTMNYNFSPFKSLNLNNYDFKSRDKGKNDSTPNRGSATTQEASPSPEVK